MTPWGESGSLRERRLRPGPGVPREDVERNQRERLYGATVAVTTTLGYGKTRVSDLIEMAGVSRATFYSLFENKEECFLATLDAVLAAALRETARPIGKGGSWELRAQGGIEAFTDLLVQQPAAARLCLVESYAAGPIAVQRVDEALAGFEQLMDRVFTHLPEHGSLPPGLTSALSGGIRKMVHTRLRRHTEDELVELLPELLALGLTYRPPPEPLLETLPGRRSAGDPPVDRGGDPVARIERATLATVAERGYGGAAITEIAAAAGVSLSTFYAHFDGKEAALDSAMHTARMRLFAAADPAYRRARGWALGTRAAIEAGLTFLEAEADFAKVSAIDVYGAGSEALELLDRWIESLKRFIAGGYEVNPEVSPVAREAIPSAMYAMLAERVRKDGARGLRNLTPLASYLALEPFLGPEEAASIANATLRGSTTSSRRKRS